MYKSFDLLKRIYFVRTGGSSEELKAANIIKEECEKLGVSAHLESFKVDGYKVKEAKLLIDGVEYECCGVGQSSSTPVEGITGKFTYITSIEDAEIQDVEGKVCLVATKLIDAKLYKRLCEKKASALILATGNVYDEKDLIDLDPYMYREKHYKNGKIPGVCIRMKDVEKILVSNPQEAYVKMIEDELQNDSYNVVATIPGDSDEVVCFTAHYDSVSYSKGAYDNGTGSTTIMQLLAYFKENKPKRTLKFIWCGSEEMGLLGSKAYVNDHKEELDKYRLNINVDMTGVTIGKDIACVTGEKGLVDYIKYLSCEVGFAITAYQGVYSSDSTPFADNGIPAISFARISPRGGLEIHCRKDVIDYLSEGNYYKTCDFIINFSNHMINSHTFPVPKTMPDNMKTELDYYLNRKER